MAASPAGENKVKAVVSRFQSSLYYCYLFLFILFSVTIIPSLFDGLSTYTSSVNQYTAGVPITLIKPLKRDIEHDKVTDSSGDGDGDDDDHHQCDMFTGEWVPNPEGQHYTSNCAVIQEHHSCVNHGRPDLGFTKWKWKPAGRGCGGADLPEFDPIEFLEAVKGKSMAFVGDSNARGQLQSLICLLWDVEQPEDVSTEKDFIPRWRYKSFNFTLAIFWSPYLVRAQQDKPSPTQLKNHYSRLNIYLDEPDQTWTNRIHDFDFLVISAGQWFFSPLYYYKSGLPIGCTYSCDDNDETRRNVTTEYPLAYGYRAAFHSAFKAILDSSKKQQGFNGTVFLRTLSPSHFEGGTWDKGGDCPRKEPRKSEEVRLDGQDKEFYLAQLEEFNHAREQAGRETAGIMFELLDVTKAMLLRPDGHPSKYRSDPSRSDCVHWCLPGPIDYWNTFLLQMIKRDSINTEHI